MINNSKANTVNTLNIFYFKNIINNYFYINVYTSFQIIKVNTVVYLEELDVIYFWSYWRWQGFWYMSRITISSVEDFRQTASVSRNVILWLAMNCLASLETNKMAEALAMRSFTSSAFVIVSTAQPLWFTNTWASKPRLILSLKEKQLLKTFAILPTHDVLFKIDIFVI